MFYSQFILAKKGPLGTIWIAAHLERKLRKNQVADTDIGVSVDSILSPDVPIALRLSSHLLLGVVRIYSRKVGYLFDDCSEALLKVKQAFRSTAVDLPPEESKAPYHSITLPETFELDDFELPDNEIFQGNYVDHHISSREQITLQDSMESVVYSTSKFGLDERFGDGDTSGLDLDEELFMDKVAAAGDASMSADPQTSVEPMTPLKQDEHHEGMAANSESMFDGVDGDADFMDHAPCTPGLAEEPNLSNIQETSACEDQLGLEDRHLPEYAMKGNLENLSCENNMNNGSKLLENQALTGGSDADTVHYVASEENGYHLGNRCDKQQEPDGELPPSGIAIDPVSLSDPALASGPSYASVHQVHAKSSALESEDEIVAVSDGQTNERNLQRRFSGLDKVDVSTPDGCHAEPQLPNGISSTKVDHDVSVLSSICQPVAEDISPSNQRSPEVVSIDVAIPGNLEPGESQDITCLETPKTYDCLKGSDLDEDTSGSQVHFLNRCNAAQLDASMSKSENVVSHEPPSNFSGFHPPETPREEASHASGDSEQISKNNLMKETVSYEDIQKDSDKSNDQVNNVVLESCQMENMSSSAASALPAPEKILSMPEGLVGLPRSIFPEATPDLMGIDEGDAGSRFISGKKRSYTESTLTEQSLNSAESSRMVLSKKTTGFIPDDDDLLSSILVGRRSSALKLKPTPPPSEITSSKRPRSATRMSASKKRVVLLMDEIMVLHGDMIRQQLINAEDIRRTRKKAPCTHAEISVIQKQLLEDKIFREAVLTGASVELASLHKQTFDLSTVKVSSSDVSCSPAIAVEPQLTSEHAGNHISSLEEQHTDAMFNEPHVEKESRTEGSDQWYEARDDSILGAVEATVPSEDREGDNHDKCLNNDASPLQPDAITDVALANGFHPEPSDNAAETGPQGTCLSGDEAAKATDIPSANEVLHSCPNNDRLGDDGDVIAGLPRTDLFDESRREDASILAEVSCGSPHRAFAAQVDEALENLNNENPVDGSGWPENENFFTYEAEAGTETRIGDEVLLDAAQDSATVEAMTNVENIVAENDNQSFADKGLGTEQPTYEEMNTEKPSTDATFEEMNMHMLDHSIGVGEHPCHQDDFSYNMTGADFSDANLGDLNDLDYSAAENDTGFLNFDDDDDDEEADDYVPDADVTRITENSGWSSRTRAVSKYLQTLFIKESERGRNSLSMDGLLVGKTKKESSRMFFEALVLKTRDYIHVEQVIPFDDITIKPKMKLMKSDF